jgi:NTE family protein
MTVATAIVLQGGGALGAYEYGVLRALYERRPGFAPVAVTGVSIGAVTAAVLGGARGDPLAALDELWRRRLVLDAPGLPPAADRSLSLLGNPGMYLPRPDLVLGPLLVDSVYDTAPLRATLAALVDPARLTDDDPRVVVGATDVRTGEMAFFDRDRPGGLRIDHVVASASLPPAFRATEVDGEHYWDGGLFSNLPLAPAIHALERAAGGDPGVRRELIVVELFAMRADVPRTLPDVLDRVFALQYTSRLTLDATYFDRTSALIDLVDRLDATLPPDSDLRDHPAYRRLRAHRRIDHVSVVTSDLPAGEADTADFSRAAIEARIAAGYADAVAQGIGDPRSGALRFGTRA